MTVYRLLLCLVFPCLLASCATAPKQKKPCCKMAVRTTAYTADEPGGARAASGELLHFGGGTYSAAADWSWLPLGTRFRMVETGREYVVEDYGSALVGKQTIDLFMPNNSAMHEWGVRQVNIEVLEWGSKAMSLKLLEPRARASSHVAVMVAALRKGVAASPEMLAEAAKPAAPQGPLLAKHE